MLPAPVIRTTAALMMVPDATLTSLSGIYSMDACVAVDPFSALEDAGFLNRHIHRYLAIRVPKLEPIPDLAKEPKSQMALRHRNRMLFCRIVVQVLSEPSLDFRYAHPFTFVIVGNLIAVDLAEGEISGFRVGEVESAHT